MKQKKVILVSEEFPLNCLSKLHFLSKSVQTAHSVGMSWYLCTFEAPAVSCAKASSEWGLVLFAQFCPTGWRSGIRIRSAAAVSICVGETEGRTGIWSSGRRDIQPANSPDAVTTAALIERERKDLGTSRWRMCDFWAMASCGGLWGTMWCFSDGKYLTFLLSFLIFYFQCFLLLLYVL